MYRKSIAQEYYALAVNEKGTMPVMHMDESNAGIVVSGIMDFILNDVITVEKKKITVIKELPIELRHLASLYTYLKDKPRSTEKMMSDYAVSTGSRIKQLLSAIGESLLEDGAAVKKEGGLFGNKAVYIPDRSYKDALAGTMKAEVAKDEISPHDIALVYILSKTKNLNQYLSKHEFDDLKAKLKEMKKNPQNKQLGDMINYVVDLTTMLMACIIIVTSLN